MEIAEILGAAHLNEPLRECGLTGELYVRIRLRGADGAVQEVTPSQQFGTTPAQAGIDPGVWSCAERTFKALRVAPFALPTFTVNYPYSL